MRADQRDDLDLDALRRCAAALLGGARAGDAALGEVLARAPRGGQRGIAHALVRRAVGHPQLVTQPAAGRGGDPARPGDLVEALAPLSVLHRGLVLLVDVLGTPASRAARVVGLSAAAAVEEHEQALVLLGEHLGEDLLDDGGAPGLGDALRAAPVPGSGLGRRRPATLDVVDLDQP